MNEPANHSVLIDRDDYLWVRYDRPQSGANWWTVDPRRWQVWTSPASWREIGENVDFGLRSADAMRAARALARVRQETSR